MKHVRDFHSQSWSNPFFNRAARSAWLKALTAAGFVLGLGLVVYAFVYSPLLRSDAVTVKGASTVLSVRVAAAAAQTLGGYDYDVIPKDHFFYIDTTSVRNYVLAQFPDLLSVDVQKNIHRLEVTVTERQPTYRFIIGDKSYLLDQQGIGLRIAAPGEGDALIAIADSSVQFVAGRAMVAPKWLNTISDLHKYFATHVGIRDQLFKINTADADIALVTVEGWYAIFDPDSDIQPQLQTLSSALGGKFTPQSRKNLSYIDARFGDKIFYLTK